MLDLVQHYGLKQDDFNLGLVNLPNRPMVRLLKLAVEIGEPFRRGQAYVSPVPAPAFGILSSFSNTSPSTHLAASL